MTVTDSLRQVVVSELSIQRAIIHIDLGKNNAYILHTDTDDDVPLAVQQWHGIIAVNYAARAYGVNRSDSAKEARLKCPDIRLVHVATFTGSGGAPAYHANPQQSTHKVSLDEYRRASRRIMEVVRRHCPDMRKASVDEAYLDASNIVKEHVLRDYDRGMLQWDAELPNTPVVRWTVKAYEAEGKGKGREPHEGGASLGVQVGEPAEETRGWADLQLRYAAAFALSVRQAVHRALGFRSSAGIAHTRALAKIGSALHKPSQQTILRRSQVAAFLADFPIVRIPSLGGKLGGLLASAFDARTAGDLLQYSLVQLEAKLGRAQAAHAYALCRGIDDSAVMRGREGGGEAAAGREGAQTLTSAKTFLRQPVRLLRDLDRW
ncbi:N-acetyltransferase eso1, partial [Kickxella alabastrina]